MKGDWRYVLIGYGEQCVGMAGTLQILLWCVEHWGTRNEVRSLL